jgi:hypothetical protein
VLPEKGSAVAENFGLEADRAVLWGAPERLSAAAVGKDGDFRQPPRGRVRAELSRKGRRSVDRGGDLLCVNWIA